MSYLQAILHMIQQSKIYKIILAKQEKYNLLEYLQISKTINPGVLHMSNLKMKILIRQKYQYHIVTKCIAFFLQKCLSMHHTQLKNRRINVLYTQGGKKKGTVKKNEIKEKNFKLHALRRQGKLAGSVKESRKRSFRRKKQRQEKTDS